jgi:hypothetical protein
MFFRIDGPARIAAPGLGAIRRQSRRASPSALTGRRVTGTMDGVLKMDGSGKEQLGGIIKSYYREAA